MVACLAPIDIYQEENVSTLSYAARASCISNVPHVNMDPRLVLIQDQKRQISQLMADLKRANDQVKFLSQGGCICGGRSQLGQNDSVTINNNYNHNMFAIIDGKKVPMTPD